jgi:hypothetical protein
MQAIAWGKIQSTTDPRFQTSYTPLEEVAKTSQVNTQGDPAIELMAQVFLTSGQLPPVGMGGQMVGMRNTVLRRADEMLRTAGFTEADLPVIREGIKGNEKAFDRLVMQSAQLQAFDGTIRRNVQLVAGA